LDLSEKELELTATAAEPLKKERRAGIGAILRTGVFACIALLCFTIAAFALGMWTASSHYQSDYAKTGKWSAWFNGPVLERDQQLVADTLPKGARVTYTLTGDLASISAGKRKISGTKDELRYHLASTTSDGTDLLGTWVASNTFVSGRKQATTPVIIDQRTASRLGVGPGDTIALEVKLADEHSNEVQGRFTALITAVARPTKQFRGVALASAPMQRFVSSAQQVEATDFYVFGGEKSTPQDLADVLARDQIRGALRSEIIKGSSGSQNSSASALRFGIAGGALLILGIYTLGELYFSARSWQVNDKNGLFSLKRARLRSALDATVCALVFAVGAVAGTFLSAVVIRALMPYEPVRATTIQTIVLFALMSTALVIARAALAHSLFRKRATAPLVIESDHD